MVCFLISSFSLLPLCVSFLCFFVFFSSFCLISVYFFLSLLCFFSTESDEKDIVFAPSASTPFSHFASAPVCAACFHVLLVEFPLSSFPSFSLLHHYHHHFLPFAPFQRLLFHDGPQNEKLPSERKERKERITVKSGVCSTLCSAKHKQLLQSPPNSSFHLNPPLLLTKTSMVRN